MNQYSAEDKPVDNTLNYTVIRIFIGERKAEDVVSDLMKVHAPVNV
ncbi:MAG: hypothetical protein ACI3W7_04335 [Oscillospiraceae bacterium]